MNRNRVKILGWYVLAIAVLQIVIYATLSLSKGAADGLIYFDPRLGIFYFESGLRGKEEVAPTLLRWVSALWLFGISICLLLGRLVKVYVLSELALSFPNILFVLAIVWANLSPAHGFSMAELFFPLLVMIAFSIVPLGIAFWARRSKDEANSFHPGRAEQTLGADSPLSGFYS